jgi:hypothetical protein
MPVSDLFKLTASVSFGGLSTGDEVFDEDPGILPGVQLVVLPDGDLIGPYSKIQPIGRIVR